jgi:DNA-binding NarL/FixJ family response regulator
MSVKTDSSSGGSGKSIRVSVVEDNKPVREHLVNLLNSTHGYCCISNHSSAEIALQELPKHNPDVVLMDINLPKLSGVDCVRRLKRCMPFTQFVMLTVSEDADMIFNSLCAGAVGYLLKGRGASGDQVLKAVHDAVSGGAPLNSLVARKIVQYFHRQPCRSGVDQMLSLREQEVLQFLSKGLPYKEIADILAVNIETIRKHCHHIYGKLQVHSRTEAAVKYLSK